ncbi:beta strand repeat-containing protein [Hymenobacter ginkgonis]|nr:T9SS type A sorting domain-containing protein [Hymenobacter ginkgonis]
MPHVGASRGSYGATRHPLASPLCGTYTINSGAAASGTNFTSFGAAVAALNANGVSCATTFNVAAGTTYLESGVALTATGTATSPIIFQKAGSGTNPRITASAGTGDFDALVQLQGSDYVTFDGIDLADAAANTTATTAMEAGYALFRNSNTDGCQHITIQNCRVTLNRSLLPPGTSSSYPSGIYAANTLAGSATSLPMAGATAAGTNSDNKFYGNTLVNVQNGLVLNALTDGLDYYPDQRNDVGGSSAATGNTVSNYGGLAAAAAGIILAGQDDSRASYNTLTNADATTGTPASGDLSAILSYGGLSGSFTFAHNTATLVAAASTGQLYGLQVANSGSGSVTIQANDLSLTTVASGAASSSDRRLIYVGGRTSTSLGTLTISDNTLALSLSSLAGGSDLTGTAAGVYNSEAIAGNLLLTGNRVQLALANTGPSQINLAGRGLFNDGQVVGNVACTGNTVILTTTATGGKLDGQLLGISNGNGAIDGTLELSDNTLTMNTSVTGAADAVSRYLLFNRNRVGNLVVNNNVLAANLRSLANGSDITGNFYGINNAGAVTGSVTATGNRGNFAISGAGESTLFIQCYGMALTSNNPIGTSAALTNNTLNFDITASAGTILPLLSAMYTEAPIGGGATFGTNTIGTTLTISGTATVDGQVVALSNNGKSNSLAFNNNILALTETNSGSASVSPLGYLLYNGGTVQTTAAFDGNRASYLLRNTGPGSIASPLSAIQVDGAVAGAATISTNVLLYNATNTNSAGTLAVDYDGLAASAPVGGTLTLANNTLLGSATASAGNFRFLRTMPATSGQVTGNLIVSGNQFENATSLGAVMAYQLGGATGTALITSNSVRNVAVSRGAITGLEVSIAGATVTRNQVYTLKGTSSLGTGVRGLVLNSGANATTNLLAYNNVIGDLTADGNGSASPTNQLIGIGVLNGYGFSLYNNSVQLAGNRAANGLSGKIAAALYIGSNAYGLDVRNNVLSNVQTTSDPNEPGTNYAVYVAGGGSPFATIDYNLYDLRPGAAAPQSLAYLNGDITTLATWQATTGQDRSSMLTSGANTAAFTSATNLTINPADASSYVLNGTGTQLPAVATDLTGAARSTTVATGAPDLGAYEVTPNAGVLPNPLDVSGTYAPGSTQTFLLNNRPIAQLTYAAAGTLPTALVGRYYSGTLPPAPTAAGGRYYQAYFTFTPGGASAGSGYSYAPTLYYDPALLGTITSESVQTLQARGATGYTNLATTVETNMRSLATSELQVGASLLAVADGSVPLPVSLTTFTAQRQGSETLLSWTTASEHANAGYEVQVSPSGEATSFRKLAFVAAPTPESQVARNYTFRDQEGGKAGLRYYRLRQLDLDGTATFSPVRSVQFEAPATAQLQAWPNPFGAALHLTVALPQAAATATITLTDALGREVLRQDLGTLPAGTSQPTVAPEALSRLPAGVYVLRLVLPGSTQVAKVIKE